MTARGARIRMLTRKGTRDDTSYSVLTREQLACDLAIAVKIPDRNDILVCGNLEYAISRGINDERACFAMLVTVVANNVGSRIRQIANGLAAGSLFELSN